MAGAGSARLGAWGQRAAGLTAARTDGHSERHTGTPTFTPAAAGRAREAKGAAAAGGGGEGGGGRPAPRRLLYISPPFPAQPRPLSSRTGAAAGAEATAAPELPAGAPGRAWAAVSGLGCPDMKVSGTGRPGRSRRRRRGPARRPWGPIIIMASPGAGPGLGGGRKERPRRAGRALQCHSGGGRYGPFAARPPPGGAEAAGTAGGGTEPPCSSARRTGGTRCGAPGRPGRRGWAVARGGPADVSAAAAAGPAGLRATGPPWVPGKRGPRQKCAGSLPVPGEEWLVFWQPWGSARSPSVLLYGRGGRCWCSTGVF